jgi:uncharacterized protein Smg (DUF494 family)
MNLFSRIAGEVRHRQELFDHEARIMETLLNDGYRLHEADAALTLMQNLVKKRSENFFGAGPGEQAAPGMRTMSALERRRFTPEAFLFAMKLTHLGVLSEDEREELVDRAMHLHQRRIDLEHVKALVAFLLFTGPSDREDAASLPFPRGGMWN